MIVEANWGNFKAKFNGREEKAFEWLCSLLFYKEHDRPTGSLRYFNQAGIEAGPITVGNEVIGFQAKFISTNIVAYKAKLIAAIDTAKAKNPTLTQIYFYVNLEFGESKKAGVKDPPYKTDIEEYAKAAGLTITWKAASFFESPFVCETNANITQHFFTLDSSVLDFVGEIARHTAAVLDPIRSSITVEGRSIKIDRRDVVARLKDTLSKSSLVIVSGEGGVGKTAVIKDFLDEIKNTAPFYVFKATEFNVSHINQVFKEYGAFTISDFIREHEEFPDKYVVVDSAEKLSDLNQPEVFQEFLSNLRGRGWKILFTTRLGYLEDLKYAFIELYHAPFEPLNIPGLTEQELVNLSVTQKFSLPESERLRRLLQNPFYLNEYLRIDPTGSGTTSYADFRETIWNRQIARSSYQKDNVHRKREECFLEIAHRRASSGRFFVTVEGFDEALRQLESDEIIKFDSKARGYFITHDIYEEWALERILEQSFVSLSAYASFYQGIGDALAIRRAFRGWLSEKLVDNDSDAARLIEGTLNDDAIVRHWKDESIVAALLSKYSATFIQHFEKKLRETPPKVVEQGESSASVRSHTSRYVIDQSLLYRTLFLLRIACKEVDQNFLSVLEGIEGEQFRLSSFVTRPKGSGWDSVIGFLNRYKEEIGLLYLHVTLPALEDWIRYNRQGDTAKAVGEIALYYLEELTKDGEFPYSRRSEVGEQLIRVILSASSEVKDQLGEIFRGVVARKEIEHGSQYHELVTTALSSIDNSAIVAASLPKDLIALAALIWPYTPPPDRGRRGSDYRNDIEQYFDLASDLLEHHPPSAFHTPILGLLQVAPRETADFILAFTNRSIDYFAKTKLAQQEVEEVDVFVDGTAPPRKQCVSDRLWNIYRGTTVAPALLQSIHMALERWLLEHVKAASASAIESWCLYLIRHSKSASITALVASVVLAEPSKLFNVAKVLFRTKEFFLFDLARMQHDMTARSLYGIGRDFNGMFQTERLKTCDDKHRTWSLENLALNYQLFRTDREDEEQAARQQKEIWQILDEHYAQLPDATQANDDKTWRLCLARMDRRKMNISAKPKDDKVLLTFSPEIDPELKEYSETTLAKTNEVMRYTPLYLWARYRWEGKSSEYSNYPQYEADIRRVVTETAEVWEALKAASAEDENFGLFYSSVPPSACAVLLRDFPGKLNDADRELCREVLLAYASLPFRAGYHYQIGDGLDAAISALALLCQSMKESRADVQRILLFALFDRHPVGIQQRFSDHAVSAILELWKTNPTDANSLFLGYLHLQPEFKKLCESILSENRKKQIFSFDHATVIQRFATEYASSISQVLSNEITYENSQPVRGLDDDALVTALMLLPLGTQDVQHKAFVVEVASAMVKKSRRRSRRGDEPLDFGTRHRFLQKFAHLVLSSDWAEIPNYVQPLVNNFKSMDYAEEIFQEFVSAEDSLNQYDAFWTVWELFYPCIVELCKTGRGFHSSSVIHNYLLAWPYWRKDAKQWHSLKEREKGFFSRVARDIGSRPAVLYSLAKLLNEIGSGFASDGIFWVSAVLERGADLADEELETNTIYYLENLVRGFVLRNRHKVRTMPQTKAAILVILNFLLEQGSVTAYLVREGVL
jgi:hypothetical protein